MTVNIHQVVENLKQTIAGKEAYRERLLEQESNLPNSVMCEMLRINIEELKVILYDVEQCAEQYSLLTWEINPERMGQ